MTNQFSRAPRSLRAALQENRAMHAFLRTRHSAALAALTCVLFTAVGHTQEARLPLPDDPDTLPDAPQVLKSGGQRFRVVAIKGFERPFAMAFLPDGNLLVTERAGR